MKKSKLDYLKNNIHKYEVDILAGTVNGKIGNKMSSGYHRVWIGYEQFYVHQVVAFVGKLNVLDNTVDHIDCNKSNNSIHNLQILSRAKNTLKARAIKLSIDKTQRQEKNEQIRADYATGKFSQKILAEKYGVTQAHVSKIVNYVYDGM